ncbi:putative pentatricopeptide repeat-containing protein At1g77010, mitochondrial [Nicotiana sylvestris]|uniref:putative pentatricopeptide repeat-containing protein At1g77010, mitochondrial n=1 Tax=Nicotiana sylvestris TaxID=4096 RepID=UPI00388C8CDB
MVIHVFYGFRDWEFSGANCFLVVDCENVAKASQRMCDTYAKCGRPDEAANVFNEVKVHDNVFLNSMITIYFNSNRIEEARKLFESTPYKRLVSWNSMLIGLIQTGCLVEAPDLFRRMNRMHFRMDKFSFSSVISAYARITSVELGEQIFARAVIIGIECDQIVSASLIDLLIYT